MLSDETWFFLCIGSLPYNTALNLVVENFDRFNSSQSIYSIKVLLTNNFYPSWFAVQSN